MIHYLRAQYHANIPITDPIGDYIQVPKDQIYTVRIRQKMFARIEAQIMRNDDPTRELVGARITYPNLFTFFMDWQPYYVSADPTYFKTPIGGNR